MAQLPSTGISPPPRPHSTARAPPFPPNSTTTQSFTASTYFVSSCGIISAITEPRFCRDSVTSRNCSRDCKSWVLQFLRLHTPPRQNRKVWGITCHVLPCTPSSPMRFVVVCFSPSPSPSKSTQRHAKHKPASSSTLSTFPQCP